MAAYYNELNAQAAANIRARMAAGLIAPGEVDERSIADVRPDDLRGFDQCHFFAGGGAWSYALRLAGWPDDRPVWTGSCPCQPFSTAGKQKGFGDERHLWPTWYALIRECGPVVVLGEQVGGSGGRKWIDLVHDDMEGSGYAVGAIDTPACSVGAPHIRQRLYWMAHAMHPQRRTVGVNREDGRDGAHGGRQETHGEPRTCGQVLRMAHAMQPGRSEGRDDPRERAHAQRATVERDGGAGGLGDTEQQRTGRNAGAGTGAQSGSAVWAISDGIGSPSAACRPGPTNGHWRAADWLGCRDGKWRPAQPGTFPLAYGIPGRVGRLREHGNAIVAPQAAEFVRIVMEAA